MSSYRLVMVVALLIVELGVPRILPGQPIDPPEMATKTGMLDCTLFHPDGKPFSGAVIEPGPAMTSNFSVDSIHKEPLATSDESGRFRIEAATDEAMGLTAFVIADGMVMDLVSSRSIGDRPLHIALRPEVPMKVIVLDQTGQPIRGAWVSPHTIYFREAFWISEVTPKVIDRIKVSSDRKGEAVLKKVDEKDVQAVWVEKPGHGHRVYWLPKNRSAGSTVELRWCEAPHELLVRVTDADSNPSEEMMIDVSMPDEAVNPLVIKDPQVGYRRFEATNEKGESRFDFIPVGQVDIHVRPSHRFIGTSFEVGQRKLQAGQLELETIEMPPLHPVHFSILDTSEGLGHSGIDVVFRKKIGARYVFATGTTDEDGLGEVWLEQGSWDVEIQHLDTIPDGYVLSGPVKTQKLMVEDDDRIKTVLPILISKGKTIEGSIEGVDLLSLRSDWIFATGRDAQGVEVEVWGKCKMDGTFRITVPVDWSEMTVETFEISHAPVTNRRKLKIESRQPWKLRWEP